MSLTAEIWCRKLGSRLFQSNLSHELAIVSALANSPLGSQICAVILGPVSAVSICITLDLMISKVFYDLVHYVILWLQSSKQTCCLIQVFGNFIKIQILLFVACISFKTRHLYVHNSLGQGLPMSLWNTDSRHGLFLFREKQWKKQTNCFRFVSREGE